MSGTLSFIFIVHCLKLGENYHPVLIDTTSISVLHFLSHLFFPFFFLVQSNLSWGLSLIHFTHRIDSYSNSLLLLFFNSTSPTHSFLRLGTLRRLCRAPKPGHLS